MTMLDLELGEFVDGVKVVIVIVGVGAVDVVVVVVVVVVITVDVVPPIRVPAANIGTPTTLKISPNMSRFFLAIPKAVSWLTRS